MSIHRFFTLSTCAIGLSLSSLQAAVVWNESIDGELSSSPSVPTSIDLITGDNTIIGSIAGPVVADISGYDEAVFTIPENNQVFSITLESYGPNATNTSLLNLYQGPIGEGGTLLASAPLDVANLGKDVLAADVALVPLAQPLEAGQQYTLEIREGGATQDYELTVHVVPEPSSVALVAMGVLALASRRRRQA